MSAACGPECNGTWPGPESRRAFHVRDCPNDPNPPRRVEAEFALLQEIVLVQQEVAVALGRMAAAVERIAESLTTPDTTEPT